MTLRVKLEIIPFGDEDRSREIARLDIFNMGGDANGRHQYGVIELTPGGGGMHEKTIVHYRALGAWELVRQVLAYLPITGP
jgi:hypothetical protein